jgi:hypothetical protein
MQKKAPLDGRGFESNYGLDLKLQHNCLHILTAAIIVGIPQMGETASATRRKL